MADNVAITAGAGTSVAADEVVDGTLGTVKAQYVKLMDGTLDSTNKLAVSAAGAAKVDGSAVTQPVSAAALPLPAGAATSALQTTMAAQLPATLGQKTASASLPTIPASDWVTVDATFKALRVTERPPEAVGAYGIQMGVAYGTTTASSPLFQIRNPSATIVMVITRVMVNVIVTAFTTAGQVERQLIIGRSWTVSDTGTAATPSKRKATHATSIADCKFGGVLTAGTRTLDASPVSSVATWAIAVGTIIQPYELLDCRNPGEYPIVLAQNEGVLVRFGGATEAASTRMSLCTVEWFEANAYP